MLNLKKSLIPMPKELAEGESGVLTAQFAEPLYSIETHGDNAGSEEAKKLIEKKFFDIAAIVNAEGDYKIIIKEDPENDKFADKKAESYFIEIKDSYAMLCGYDPAGVFYAAVTFTQMLYKEGDNIYIKKADIYDYPDFSCRGHFIESRYGTEFLTLQNWYDFIDYMALMKINQITIGVYGCWGYQYDGTHVEYMYIPYKKQPKLNTPQIIKYYSVKEQKWIYKADAVPYMFEQDYFGDVIAYAKRRNITVKPLVNSLGHNTLMPRMIPEISAKKEDGTPANRGFCTRNEKTYEVILGFYDEIIDRYLKPNGITDFHIGLDEVGESYVCHCEKCAGTQQCELMVEYIIELCKHLKKRGMKRIYIYHDMLYQIFDTVNEELRDRFIKEGIYDAVVLDWWTYEDPAHLFWDKADGVNNLFHSVIKPDTGYYNWVIPTENNENIRACAKKAKELSFEGIESYSSLEYCYDKNYLTLADIAWNSDGIDGIDEFNERYAYRNYPENAAKAANVFNGLFDIMRDETGECYMNRVCWKFEYYFYGYRRGEQHTLQNFPGDAYKLFSGDEKKFTAYFEYLKQKAMPAVEFFENSGVSSKENDMWLLTSKHYYTIADEYLTIYGLYKSYNANEADGYEVMRELDRLIKQREQLMLLAENVRIEATQYTYLRNMSVFRQFMLDLINYFKKEISCGRKPEFNMLNADYVTGKAFDFLR